MENWKHGWYTRFTLSELVIQSQLFDRQPSGAHLLLVILAQQRAAQSMTVSTHFGCLQKTTRTRPSRIWRNGGCRTSINKLTVRQLIPIRQLSCSAWSPLCSSYATTESWCHGTYVCTLRHMGWHVLHWINRCGGACASFAAFPPALCLCLLGAGGVGCVAAVGGCAAVCGIVWHDSWAI